MPQRDGNWWRLYVFSVFLPAFYDPFVQWTGVKYKPSQDLLSMMTRSKKNWSCWFCINYLKSVITDLKFYSYMYFQLLYFLLITVTLNRERDGGKEPFVSCHLTKFLCLVSKLISFQISIFLAMTRLIRLLSYWSSYSYACLVAGKIYSNCCIFHHQWNSSNCFILYGNQWKGHCVNDATLTIGILWYYVNERKNEGFLNPELKC